MKKLLLTLIFVGSIANAQVLLTENFETLTIGNVTSDPTGATAGQGGWSTSGSAATDFQIINSGTDKDLKIIGAPADATTSRYMWKDGLPALWAGRTSGNNIIQIEYDFFTGAATTSKNTIGMELYNTAYAKTLGGFSMNADTKVISGVFSNATGTSPSFVNLATGGLTLPANQWVRVGWAYNSTTGVITFKGPGFNGTVTGAITDVYELDFVMENSATGNTSSFNSLYDNLVVTAVPTVNLLKTSEVTLGDADIIISPNPAKDFLNVTSKTKILAIYIYDMSGIRMDAKMVDGKVDVRTLQTGTYMLGVKTDNGLVTKKFIKN